LALRRLPLFSELRAGRGLPAAVPCGLLGRPLRLISAVASIRREIPDPSPERGVLAAALQPLSSVQGRARHLGRAETYRASRPAQDRAADSGIGLVGGSGVGKGPSQLFMRARPHKKAKNRNRAGEKNTFYQLDLLRAILSAAS
jgi:hypothetical protein